MKRKLAIIPARGGSKRIPRKNAKEFLGKPIIVYSIETALASDLFDEVMVSTDDYEISEIAIKYGAKVPVFRSSQNSGDFASTKSVIDEVVLNYEANGFDFDAICCIYPTAPLATIEHIKEGLRILQSKKMYSVMPIVAYNYPIQRSLRVTEERAQMLWPENMNARSQDLERVYHDAGQWYWISKEGLSHPIYNERTGVIVLSDLEVQDIDKETDWRLAELKYQIRSKQNEQF